MAETGPGAAEERIADLLRQWKESPAPRVGLQLAEEYRRTGRHADARAVLERSLENHPGHLSSLVALGKAQLDLGEAAEAAARFQQVLGRDPTHLVAGKLLIEAHLRRGDAAGARERLDLYRLLNAGDPELEDLARRTGELEEAGEPAGPPPAAAVLEETAAAPTEPAAELASGAAPAAVAPGVTNSTCARCPLGNCSTAPSASTGVTSGCLSASSWCQTWWPSRQRWFTA